MLDFLYSNSAFFLYSLVIGAFIGALYDFFRIVRMFFKTDTKIFAPERLKKYVPFMFEGKVNGKISALSDKIITFVTDLIFSALTGIIFILFLYYANLGQIRIICIIGAFLAFLIYYKTIGRLTVFFSSKILILVKTLIFWVCFVIIYPLNVLKGEFCRICGKIWAKYKAYKKRKRIDKYSERKIKELLTYAKNSFAKGE